MAWQSNKQQKQKATPAENEDMLPWGKPKKKKKRNDFGLPEISMSWT